MQNQRKDLGQSLEHLRLALTDREWATLKLAARVEKQTPADFARRAILKSAGQIVNEWQPGALRPAEVAERPEAS